MSKINESNEYHNDLKGWENLLVQDIKLAGYGDFSEDIIPIEYSKNDLGYRSRPFENKSDILFLGDSFTRGDGLPVKKHMHTCFQKS